MWMSRKMSVAMASLVAVAAPACASDALDVNGDVTVPAGAVSLQPEEISLQTGWSGFDQTTRTVITDNEAWAAAWGTLHANLSPVPDRPPVDFQTHVLILAAMGSRPSTGYSVTIESVHHHDGVLYVSVRERSPGPSCLAGAAITSPVHVVQVPREGTTAHFNVRSETFSC